MVGGIVIETITLPDRIWVNCREVVNGRSIRNECAIYVERNVQSEAIRVGDNVWWQGSFAMWTPRDRSFTDVKIPRRGYSGVRRPEMVRA